MLDIEKLTDTEIEFVHIVIKGMLRDFTSLVRVLYPHVGESARYYILDKEAEVQKHFDFANDCLILEKLYRGII